MAFVARRCVVPLRHPEKGAACAALAHRPGWQVRRRPLWLTDRFGPWRRDRRCMRWGRISQRHDARLATRPESFPFAEPAGLAFARGAAGLAAPGANRIRKALEAK